MTHCLPDDAEAAILVGRIWISGETNGPCIVKIENGEVYDLTAITPTMASLINHSNPLTVVCKASKKNYLGNVDAYLEGSSSNPDNNHLLAPNDIQSIKACGVTFVDSMLERIVEEKALGDPSKAEEIRKNLIKELGSDLSTVIPGTQQTEKIKEYLINEGLWSQYLEVGLGPDAEIFTKSQPMSAVGTGAEIGLHPSSIWNNSEPELVLAINYRGDVIGASLGNDVNLRDIEGRSALLLGHAKDNNGSCAIGPFIRLLDDNFTLDNLRRLQINLHIEGNDGFKLDAHSDMSNISRDIEDLVQQVIGPHHQYPDGLMLFTGTPYTPVEDRGSDGKGFNHNIGDKVIIHSPQLGSLINTVNLSTRIKPWDFGISALFENLARRGYLNYN